LAYPASGQHLCHAMLLPRPEARELLQRLEVDGSVDLGATHVSRVGKASFVELRNPSALNALDETTLVPLETAIDLAILDRRTEIAIPRGGTVNHPKYAGRRIFSAGINLTHLYQIRMLFDHLVTGGVLEHNPALSVKAPRQILGKGKTPVLTAEEAGELLRSIETDTVVGLRDRALIGVMVFTFARVSAACGLNLADIFHQQRRRLHEKGGKFHEMPCHHTLEAYLGEY